MALAKVIESLTHTVDPLGFPRGTCCMANIIIVYPVDN